MNDATRSEYRRLRALGWFARHALNAARVNVAFEAAERDGMVRVRVEPDDEPYDVSYVDTWDDLTERQREHIKRSILDRADMEGVWGLIAERRCPCCGQWEHVDSCWGFIGDDWRDAEEVSCREVALESIYQGAAKEQPT